MDGIGRKLKRERKCFCRSKLTLNHLLFVKMSQAFKEKLQKRKRKKGEKKAKKKQAEMYTSDFALYRV